MFSFQSIKVVKVSEERYCLSLIWNNCRFRFYNGKGWSGVSFVQKANGLFDPAVPSYSEWVDNRMKLIISE